MDSLTTTTSSDTVLFIISQGPETPPPSKTILCLVQPAGWKDKYPAASTKTTGKYLRKWDLVDFPPDFSKVSETPDLGPHCYFSSSEGKSWMYCSITYHFFKGAYTTLGTKTILVTCFEHVEDIHTSCLQCICAKSIAKSMGGNCYVTFVEVYKWDILGAEFTGGLQACKRSFRSSHLTGRCITHPSPPRFAEALRSPNTPGCIYKTAEGEEGKNHWPGTSVLVVQFSNMIMRQWFTWLLISSLWLNSIAYQSIT